MLWSGCGEDSAWWVLPGPVQADPGPALPHLHGACSRGREEFHHQRQVSLALCILCNCLIGDIFYFVLFWWGGAGVSHWWCTTQDYRKQPKWMIAALILSKIKTTLFKTCSHVKSSLKEKSLPLSKCKMKRCLFWWKYKWCKPLVTHRLDQKTRKGACTVLTKIT